MYIREKNFGSAEYSRPHCPLGLRAPSLCCRSCGKRHYACFLFVSVLNMISWNN